MTVEYQVLILAAGKGVRMRSSRPKVLHRLCGLTLIERVIRAASAAKPKQITVVVGSGADQVEAEIQRLRSADFLAGVKVVTVLQTEQKGTGHAVQVAQPALNPAVDRVLILPGDVPLLRTETVEEILAGDAADPASALLVISSCPPSAQGYGRLVRGDDGRVLAIVEQKDCSPAQAQIREINTAIYCASNAFLQESLPALRAENAQREYYLTDIVEFGVTRGRKVRGYQLKNYLDAAGANSRAELSDLEQQRRQQLNRRLMEGGVTLENPGAVYVDEDVRVGEDCFLGANVRLRGKTNVGAGAVIDGDSLIGDSIIGERSHVGIGCVIEASHIGNECRIAPHSVLPEGTELPDCQEIRR